MPDPLFTAATDSFALAGVDAEAALQAIQAIPLSLPCWQGDDVGGFEDKHGGQPGGGLQVTGNYPGKARCIDELRQDFTQALALIPGRHRLNLHASYADFFGRKTVPRDELAPAQFQSWIDWAGQQQLGLDFNPTYFAHPLADGGATLTHAEPAIREFWVRHGIVCRRIAAEMGRQLGSATVTNVWIPDGSKDQPIDRRGPRERLAASLEAIFAEDLDAACQVDAVEAKLFGIGSESYVAGSHEFYLGFATKHQTLLCLDAGHFHPTESVADKVSAILQFVPGLLLHLSRGVRWDSDHVVILDDATRAIMEELVRGDYLPRTRLGLDYFDASINRVAAWVIGARSTLRALLMALLQPLTRLREAEAAGDFTSRLALQEESKLLPAGAIWDEYCRRQNVPVGTAWLAELRSYERDVQSKRV